MIGVLDFIRGLFRRRVRATERAEADVVDGLAWTQVIINPRICVWRAKEFGLVAVVKDSDSTGVTWSLYRARASAGNDYITGQRMSAWRSTAAVEDAKAQATRALRRAADVGYR